MRPTIPQAALKTPGLSTHVPPNEDVDAARQPSPHGGYSQPAGRSVTIYAMEAPVPELGVAEGYEALATGDSAGARVAFEAALEAEPSSEAPDGLGSAVWWLRFNRR